MATSSALNGAEALAGLLLVKPIDEYATAMATRRPRTRARFIISPGSLDTIVGKTRRCHNSALFLRQNRGQNALWGFRNNVEARAGCPPRKCLTRHPDA